MAQPGFWEAHQGGETLLKERTELNRQVETWQQAQQQLEDLQIMQQLVSESQDPAETAEAQAELDKGLQHLQQQVQQMELARMLSGEHDARNAILSINAGAGGTEAQDWAQMLLRMYLRFCERRGLKTEFTDYQPGDEAGIKGATLEVSGSYAYGWLRPEMGIHRLVRISPFDANAKRHTSFCSVFVFPELPDDIDIEVQDKDLKVDTFRASGAGGQHVNKTDSAIRMTHLPTGIVVACQNERSQHKNRAVALKQLKARLYEQEKAKKEAEAEAITGDKKEIGWGSQIRSYVLHPYRMVKDHRTGYEVGNTDAVLDGHIEGFLEAYLLHRE